jgi:hypothetical protein
VIQGEGTWKQAWGTLFRQAVFPGSPPSPQSLDQPNGWDHNPWHKSPKATKTPGLSSLGRNAGRVEGAQPLVGVILDCIVMPVLGHPSVLPELGQASSLETLKGCKLWKVARAAGWEGSTGKALPLWGQNSEWGLSPEVLCGGHPHWLTWRL